MTWEKLHDVMGLWMDVSLSDRILAGILVVALIGLMCILMVGPPRGK